MMSKDQSNPDKFKPPLTAHSGANWFDPDLNMLWIVIKGDVEIDIRTTAVVQVSLIKVNFPRLYFINFLVHQLCLHTIYIF